jgi:ribosomal protein S18 acetylase RimI-like enzyme
LGFGVEGLENVMAISVCFRLAKAADALCLAEIYLMSRKTFVSFAPLAHSDEEVREWIAHSLIPQGVIVAFLDEEIVGMMALSRDGNMGWIEQLYVDPAFLRRGIGSQLVERAKAELGVPIRLYTFQENDPARHFYERHGFEAIAFGDGSGNEEKCPDVLYEWQG